jgi:hypothetical protein
MDSGAMKRILIYLCILVALALFCYFPQAESYLVGAGMLLAVTVVVISEWGRKGVK